jgi:hypothetical protein
MWTHGIDPPGRRGDRRRVSMCSLRQPNAGEGTDRNERPRCAAPSTWPTRNGGRVCRAAGTLAGLRNECAPNSPARPAACGGNMPLNWTDDVPPVRLDSTLGGFQVPKTEGGMFSCPADGRQHASRRQPRHRRIAPAERVLGRRPRPIGQSPADAKAFGAHCAADISLLTLRAAVVVSLNGSDRRCLAFVSGQVGDADPQV